MPTCGRYEFNNVWRFMGLAWLWFHRPALHGASVHDNVSY